MKNPRRFIVEVWDDMPLDEAFSRCAVVAKNGKISAKGKQHCLLTQFVDGSSVHCNLNKTSERFRVCSTKQIEKNYIIGRCETCNAVNVIDSIDTPANREAMKHPGRIVTVVPEAEGKLLWSKGTSCSCKPTEGTR